MSPLVWAAKLVYALVCSLKFECALEVCTFVHVHERPNMYVRSYVLKENNYNKNRGSC